MDKDLEAIEKEIEQRKNLQALEKESEQSNELQVAESSQLQTIQETALLPSVEASNIGGAISDVKQKIVEKAAKKINDEKIIEKHSENIAKISDRALEVEAEKQRLVVEQVNADNKVVAQEIKNRLIVLKAEAKRLKAEQKQLDLDQKAAHKARNKQAKWDIYGDKLKRMKYDYVPNVFVLSMLLFFDGVKGFFDGLGAVSTAIVKAFKWIIIVSLIFAVLMIVPVTREWLLSVLQFI